MVRVKICGITNKDDAYTAVQAGADALGFIFTPKSPRCLSLETAGDIIDSLNPYCMCVGVFMDQKPAQMQAIADRLRLGAIQLHGKESPLVCKKLKKKYKVVKTLFPGKQNLDRMLKVYDNTVDAFLLDVGYEEKRKGQSQFKWNEIRESHQKFFSSGVKIIISGGLTPDTVEEAVKVFHPYGVDVARGVEYTTGLKDKGLVKVFVHRVKKV